MSNPSAILQRVHAAERELDQAITAWRKEIKHAAASKVAAVSKQVRAEQRKLRRSLFAHIRSIGLLLWLTAPFIYALIVPLVLIDLFATLYQFVCFPVYGIGRVRRSDYVIIDRHRLPYLNALEKLNCAYCSYANGVVAYARELASRTEQYFCPIKHAIAAAGAHSRYPRFVDYGNAEEYRRRFAHLRKTAGDF
jgi:hypothetical protein